MEHVAVDLGGRESQICVRDEHGEIVAEQRVQTQRLGRWLARRPQSRVILETCAESFWAAEVAQSYGHEVRVVPATLVRSLGVGARRIKTDQRDARCLSEVSSRISLPSVHIPSSTARERKTLCSMRQGLVGMRTQSINMARGWLRGQACTLPSGSSPTFARRVRQRLLELNVGVPTYVERTLIVIESLCEQIAAADRELAAIANTDPVCTRLMTVPGIGPITAVNFVATVDDVQRFTSAHQLQSFLGLTPGESSSGQRKHRLSITKAGPGRTRWTLVQAAWSVRRCHRGSRLWHWGQTIEQRRGKHIAVVAMARKIAGILYAIWRTEQNYDPMRAARAIDV